MVISNDNSPKGLLNEGDPVYILIADIGPPSAVASEELHWVFSSMGKLAEFVTKRWADDFASNADADDGPDQMAWFLAAGEEDQIEFLASSMELYVLKARLDSTTAAEDLD